MEAFPTEIQQLIASFTCDATKRQLRLASTEWLQIINYSDFTVFLTKKSEWKQIVDRFEKYKPPISLKLQKNIMNNLVDIMEQLSRLTNLTSLTVDNFHSDGRGWEQLALMTNLKVVEGLIGTPNYVWKQLTRLQSLESKYDKKKLTDFLDVVPYLTNLESLNTHTEHTIRSIFSDH
jgi:hypothetical protein